MKTHYNTGNYGNELSLTKSDALRCSHSGDCERDVIEVSQKPYVKKQLALLSPENLAKELKEYGAWDAEQLADHQESLIRWVWISACDIAERLA